MPPRPRSPRPRPTPSRRPRVAGMAPTVARPSERAEEATEATVVAPDRPAEAAPPGDPGGKPKRPRPKPAPEPTGDGTERLPVVEDGKPAKKTGRKPARSSTVEPAEPVVDGTERLPVVEGEKPAKNGGRKPARATTVEPAEPVVDGTERLPIVDGEQPAEPAATPRKKPARSGTAGATETVDATEENAGRGARLAALLRRRAVPLLAVAAVLLGAVAVFAGIQDAQLRGTPAAQNTALVDVGTTAEVAGQLSDAIETVYSFDFARLDENENAARNVITPEFAAEFDRLFGEVRARAPQQQAVVSATVTHTAVKEITGDRAVLVAFVDQQATRAAPDAQSQQLAAAGRLTVTGERVDGHWKIAAVTPL
jgi:Mce-associated membrane protein